MITYKRELIMTKYLRDIEKIFLAGNTQIECKEDLAKIVEEPCLAVCENLYDKNILTYWSSANKDAPNHAFVLIRYESLDERNKAIADRLINEGKIKEDKRFESWNSFDGQYGKALYLGIDTYPDMSVDEISQSLCSIAQEFEMQDIKYNIYTPEYLIQTSPFCTNKTEFAFPDLKTAICGDNMDERYKIDSRFTPEGKAYMFIIDSMSDKKIQDITPEDMQSIADKLGWIYNPDDHKIYKDEETIRRHNNFLEYQKLNITETNNAELNLGDFNDNNETDISTTSSKPEYLYNEKTGEFNYKNPEFQQKAEVRRKIKLENKDYLEYKLKRIKKKLGYAGLDEDIGKTGDSCTGEVAEKHKRVAEIQAETTKTSPVRFKQITRNQ